MAKVAVGTLLLPSLPPPLPTILASLLFIDTGSRSAVQAGLQPVAVHLPQPPTLSLPPREGALEYSRERREKRGERTERERGRERLAAGLLEEGRTVVARRLIKINFDLVPWRRS